MAFFGNKPNTQRPPHRRRRATARKVVVGLFLTFLTVFIAFWIVVWCSRKPFVRPDSHNWQTGDIFFSAGNSWRSIVVKWYDSDNPEGLTHSGFVVIENGRPMLVHMSTEKGEITKETIDEYARINDVSAIVVRRLNSLPDTAALRRNLDDLMKHHMRFDNNFNHNNATEYYCTELVIRELQKLGIRDFDSLLANDYVYPVQIARHPAVHNLPTP